MRSVLSDSVSTVKINDKQFTDIARASRSRAPCSSSKGDCDNPKLSIHPKLEEPEVEHVSPEDKNPNAPFTGLSRSLWSLKIDLLDLITTSTVVGGARRAITAGR